MSSYATHMLIGGVAGLALTQVLPAGSLPGISPLWTEIALVGGSAILASWPDIDEPGSWISRRVRLAVVLVCTAIGGLVGYSLAPRVGMQPLTVALIGMLLGVGLVGPILGFLLLRLIRRAAGGHRRLTHSLLVGGALAMLALILWSARMPAAALVPAALAWGQLLHLLGDVYVIWNMMRHRCERKFRIIFPNNFYYVDFGRAQRSHIPHNRHNQRRPGSVAAFDARYPPAALPTGAPGRGDRRHAGATRWLSTHSRRLLMDKRFWCLCCEIPRPFLDLAGAEQHLAGVHRVALASAVQVERLRADGVHVACMQLADGRPVLRMHTVRKRAFAYTPAELAGGQAAPCMPTLSPAAQPGVEVLEVSGVDTCYDRGLDLLHLADGDRVLCSMALAPSLDDCRYQHPPLLWSWLTCAACAQAAIEAGRAAWRRATVSEAAATIWSARSAAAYWFALALYEELARTADGGHMVAVRVLRDGVAVSVRVAEADWQRGVIVDSDPVGVPHTLALQGWGFVDDAACITLDDSDVLTAERAAADAAALLALLEGEAVIKLLPNRPRLRPELVA